MDASLIKLAYVVAAILFIFGLKNMSHPRTAVRGNLLGALGMFVAVVVTLTDQNILGNVVGYYLIGIGVIIGALIGALV